MGGIAVLVVKEKLWGYSSVGRAGVLYTPGPWFESMYPHSFLGSERTGHIEDIHARSLVRIQVLAQRKTARLLEAVFT